MTRWLIAIALIVIVALISLNLIGTGVSPWDEPVSTDPPLPSDGS